MYMSHLRCSHRRTQLTPALGYSSIKSQIARTLSQPEHEMVHTETKLTSSRVRTISRESGCMAAAISTDRRAAEDVVAMSNGCEIIRL